MKWIYDVSYDGLTHQLTQAGFKAFAANQVFQWLYGKNQQDLSAWSNISKSGRELLAEMYDTNLNAVETVKEDEAGTCKLLIRLQDGNLIEAVLIKEKDHFTFCISSQVGCALACTFCATGKLGFTRNLSPGEILAQILLLKKRIPDYTGKLNLVFMGMGEPLLNYENLKQALNVITAENGLSISPRNITVSTAGILKTLRNLERDFPRIKVSFSLNTADSSLRLELMPIGKKELPETILDYFRNTERKHRVTFEYVMIHGVNDSLENARKLAALLRGISCKINLIPYNPNSGIPYKSPGRDTVENFSEFLHDRGYTVVVRWSKGRGIGSACGQLAAGKKFNAEDTFEETLI